MSGSAKPGDEETSPVPAEPTARFGPGEAPSFNVQVNAQNLHINPSNFSALERIVQINPDIASQLIQVSRDAVKYERDRYKVGAVCSVIVCSFLLLCAAAVIISSGFWPGIAFFLSCVVVAAIVAAIYTGKVQDLSWTVRAIPGTKREKTNNQNESPAD